MLSLPVRECGLKQKLTKIRMLLTPSLPVRECGLKQNYDSDEKETINVTPRAGVWIET